MNSYPVIFSVDRPERFQRAHIALRVIVLFVVSLVGLSLGVFFSLLYLILPVVTALLVSEKGVDRFAIEDTPRLERAIRWVLSVYAYFALVTDRLPINGATPSVQYAVLPSGAPTVGSALIRLLKSLPMALILGLLACISWFVWLIAAAFVLFTETYPEGLYNFQCGVLRWLARLFAYHTSLVDAYPPFDFDPGPEPAPHAL